MASSRKSEPGSFHLIFKVVGVYFVSLIVLILITIIFKIRLYEGMDWLRFPTTWGWLLLAWFYIFPFIFGAVGGFAFRPFIRNFVFITALIFFLHGVYTFFAFSLRSEYLRELESEAELSRRSTFSLTTLTHEFKDDNGDGLVDRIAVSGRWTLTTDSPGEYEASLYLVQNNHLVAGGSLGGQKLPVETTGTKGFDFAFSLNPVHIRDTLASGMVEINLDLKKNIRISSHGKIILAVCRWAPFLERTSLEGYDLDIIDAVPQSSESSPHRCHCA